jgi:hypothetical protein
VTLLAKVQDSFELPSSAQSCRCVIVIKLLTGRIRVKDPIQLRTPEGSVRGTYIAALEHVKYNLLAPPPDKDTIGICLPPEFTKQDVPLGTEIWSMKD